MRRGWIVMGALAAAGVSGALAWPRVSEATEPPSLEQLAHMAVDEDPEIAEPAIAALRTHGPSGHAALMSTHAEAIARLREAPERGEPREREPRERAPTERAPRERLRHAIDVTSGQRDGHASGLYWHTDIAAARIEARRTGRPILSLRLLGNLDEELSCANSRYFRVVLYSDPRVAERLREHFVLHWSSERPAPRIEIDMGDGRRMVRTITGNSAHYVLDRNGRPVDAIVGLYAPDHFLSVLEQAEHAHSRCSRAGDRSGCLARAHRAALRASEDEWATARGLDISMPTLENAIASLPDAAPSVDAPSAAAAMPLTIGKSSVEMPMVRAMQRGGARGARAPRLEEPDWTAIARRRGRMDRGMDDVSTSLLRLKLGSADVSATATSLTRTAAADGERNEVLFRRRVHQWFVDRATEVGSFEAMNARVYAELMLTPADDPWLGLRADDVYDAIEVAAE